MADKNDRDPSEELRYASDQFVLGLLDTGRGFVNLVLSTWRVMGEYQYLWFIRYPIAAALTGLIGKFVIWLGRVILSYLLIDGGIVTPDVEVPTTPLPLGVSVTILMIAVGSLALLTFVGYVRLRQRVDDLEKRVEV